MPKRPPVPIVGDVLDRLIAAAETPVERALVLILADTGVRISEAIGLEWRDLDLAARTINVERQHDGRAPKWGGTRYLALSDRLAAALAALDGPRDGRVLPFKIRHARTVLQRVARHAGITAPVRCHGMRHGFAVRLLETTHNDLLSVRDALGHGHTSTTDKYLRQAGTRVHEGMRRLG